MPQAPTSEHHYLLRYTKTGAARYLSLHDVRRAWERATRRAGLPLAYSQGFSPKPRLSFGPPLAVGDEGLRECLVISLRELLPPRAVHERLTAAAVDGLSPRELAQVSRRKFTTVWAAYTLSLHDPPANLPTRVDRLLSEDAVPVARPPRSGRASQTHDIRPGIQRLEARDGTQLEAQLSLRNGCIVTPRDLASALNITLHRTVRTEVEIRLPECMKPA